MTDIFYGIGDFFKVIFRYWEKLGNIPNVIFIIICFVAMVVWLKRMDRYNKDAEQNGTLK